MNNDEASPEQPQRNITGLRKKIIPFEESGPQTEPLFINYVHGAFVGGSGYLDVGVIPLEEFISPDDHDAGLAEFAVLTRLVMSKETMILMRDQINEVLARNEALSAGKS